MVGSCADGMRLIRIALFPFIKSSDSLEVAWLQHSLSSTPVCLATACASFFTCFSAVLCHPPRDSKARGTKATPCLSHSSAVPLIFRLKAKSKLWPGVSAACATVACWSGFMTVMSKAASRPSAQFGTYIHRQDACHNLAVGTGLL